MATCD